MTVRNYTLALARPISSTLWELRAAWATGRRVTLSLDRANLDRVEGHVLAVAASGASVTVSGWLIPLDRVLAVHHPSRLGDSTCRGREQWHGRARLTDPIPGQLILEPES